MSEENNITENETAKAAAAPELPPLKAGDAPSHEPETPGKTRVSRIPYERRKALYGLGFISLWLIGTIVFFLIPLGKSLWYSFNDVSITTGQLKTEWIGLDNYDYAFNTDPNFTDYLEDMLLETLWKTPLILISLTVHRSHTQPEIPGQGALTSYILPAGHHRNWSCVQDNQRRYGLHRKLRR